MLKNKKTTMPETKQQIEDHANAWGKFDLRPDIYMKPKSTL